jgi:hypothetical protein
MLFDFIVDQLLELLRVGIYRRAHRPLPKRGEAATRGKMSVSKEETEAPEKAKVKRRRAFNPLGNPVVLGLTLLLAFLVFRRMVRRA